MEHEWMRTQPKLHPIYKRKLRVTKPHIFLLEASKHITPPSTILFASSSARKELYVEASWKSLFNFLAFIV